MNCTDMTAIVATMPAEGVEELLILLAEVDLSIIRPPRSALVMMPLLDSFQTEFNLGEVLVTETLLTIDGVEGFGMVIGDDPRRAMARAAADAILKGAAPQLRERLEELLMAQEGRRRDTLARERTITATTRVSFDLMPGA